MPPTGESAIGQRVGQRAVSRSGLLESMMALPVRELVLGARAPRDLVSPRVCALAATKKERGMKGGQAMMARVARVKKCMGI